LNSARTTLGSLAANCLLRGTARIKSSRDASDDRRIDNVTNPTGNVEDVAVVAGHADPHLCTPPAATNPERGGHRQALA